MSIAATDEIARTILSPLSVMTPTEKLRVLQVVDGFRLGGAETKLLELIKKLDRSRFAPAVANVGPGGPLESAFKELDCPVHDFRRRHRFDLHPFRQLYRLIRQQRIQVVQTTLFWADFAGTLTAHLAKAPVILSWETVSHEGNQFHHKWHQRAGYRFAMRFASGVVAVSNEIKTSLMQRRNLPAAKVHVIPYGVDLQRFSANGAMDTARHELQLDPQQVVIGVVARLEKVKGHEYFIAALRKVVDRYPNAVAVLIGDGEQRPHLEALMAQHSLQAHLRFLGFRNDVQHLLRAIDLLVLPSISEGLPNVILEAMACGKPVVASNVGGIPEAVRPGQNGLLVAPRDVDGLAQAMEQLVALPEKRRELGQQGRRIVEQEFSLQSQVSRFEQLYESLYRAATRTGA